MRLAIVLLLALLMVGCSPQKRLQRFLSNHPEFARRDTIIVHDTIYIRGDSVRGSVELGAGDTGRVDSGKIRVRIVRVPTGSPCDTAAFRADILAWVEPDTIIREIPVVVDRIVPCPEGYKGRVASWWRVVALCLGCVVALLVLVRRLG